MGAVVNAAVSAISQKITTGTVNWAEVGINAGAGFLSGALAATGLGAVAQVAGNALISGAESFVSQGVDYGFKNVDYKEVVVEAAIGGVSSRNVGISKGNGKHLWKQGVDSVKNYRGLKKTAKYYFKQTYKMFYKPLLTKAPLEILSGTAVESGGYYAKKTLERFMYD